MSEETNSRQPATPKPKSARAVVLRRLIRRVAAFEQWITAPPHERSVARFGPDETKREWPGQYKDAAVQLAWEAWQQSPHDQVEWKRIAIRLGELWNAHIRLAKEHGDIGFIREQEAVAELRGLCATLPPHAKLTP